MITIADYKINKGITAEYTPTGVRVRLHGNEEELLGAFLALSDLLAQRLAGKEYEKEDALCDLITLLSEMPDSDALEMLDIEEVSESEEKAEPTKVSTNS